MLTQDIISVINTWVTPIATYKFSAIKWTDTSLQGFDRKIETILTRHRLHHPYSLVHILHLPLVMVQTEGFFVWKRYVVSRKIHFDNIPVHWLTVLHRAVCSEDKCISHWICSKKIKSSIIKSSRLYHYLERKGNVQHISVALTLCWGRMFSFCNQDQVIKTRAYWKNILSQQIESEYCLCIHTVKSIWHISCGCLSLALSEFHWRHNNNCMKDLQRATDL